MQVVPARFGKQAFEVPLGLRYVFARTQAPALREAVDVRIHGKGGHAKGLGQDHAGGFMPHTRQAFEGVEVGRHLALVLIEQDLREASDGRGFLRRESTGADDAAYGVHGHPHHGPR